VKKLKRQSSLILDLLQKSINYKFYLRKGCVEGADDIQFKHLCKKSIEIKLIDCNQLTYRMFNIFPVDEMYQKERNIWDEYFNKFCLGGHKIGGYPNFVQRDPRDIQKENEEPYMLLL
jgi:uncharacterized protein YwqG